MLTKSHLKFFKNAQNRKLGRFSDSSQIESGDTAKLAILGKNPIHIRIMHSKNNIPSNFLSNSVFYISTPREICSEHHCDLKCTVWKWMVDVNVFDLGPCTALSGIDLRLGNIFIGCTYLWTVHVLVLFTSLSPTFPNKVNNLKKGVTLIYRS